MSIRTTVIVTLVLAACSGTARAQTPDHLECYKVTDPLKLQAFVDLDSPQFGVASNCKVGRTKFFCVPAAKTVLSALDKATGLPITPLAVTGPNAGDRICYKVTCAEPFPADTEASDQFGTRTLTRFKTQMLCAPAIKGTPEPPPATPTPIETPTPTATQTPGPRFVDNGDGTVTDNQTGLQWEKKVSPGLGDDDPNDVDNIYSWEHPGTGGCGCGGFPDCPSGSAYTRFLGRLNDCTSSDGTAVTDQGFAGHCDWRLPTIQELQSIVDLGAPGCGSGGSCIDPIFGPTASSPPLYWSRTTVASDTVRAWMMNFNTGSVDQAGKLNEFHVRAVRRAGP